MINQEDESGRRAQILDAAIHVMAEHGFRGASIKRIAERAGLKSPALIYWYFKDKYALLEAILERMSPFLVTVTESDTSALDEPPDVVLPRIVKGFMTAIQQPKTGRLVRILMSEFAKHPVVAEFFAQRGPLLVLRFLERYLTRQIELGRLRAHDPRGSARAFMGMLLVYALGRELFPSHVGAGFPDAEAYARQVTEIFLNGLSAD